MTLTEQRPSKLERTMVRKDRDVEAAVEIGRKNARLWSPVERWCRHLKIEQVSGGLLGSAYNLPIGMLRVSCPHGISHSESMHLDWEAKSFILANCIGCPHHAETHPDNYGRKILQDKEEADAEAQQLCARREQLRQHALKTAREALETREITEKSVNTLILEAQSDTDEGQRVRDQLNEAARIAPEMFSDSAVRVIVDSFTGPSAPTYIRCAAELCRSRRHIPDFLLGAVLKTIDIGPIEAVDSACLVLELDAQLNGPSTLQSALDSLLRALDRTPRCHTGDEDEDVTSGVSGIIAVLRTCMRADPDLVVAQLRSRLSIDDKNSRLRTGELLRELMPTYPGQVLALVPELLASLELADDPYGESADHAACDVLSHLYIHSPGTVEPAVEERWARASDDVRKPLLRIYGLIARHASQNDRFSAPVFRKDIYKEHLPTVAEKALLTLGDVELSSSLRRDACRLLDEFAEEWPDLLTAYIPRLLGRLRMTVQESKSLPQRGTDALGFLRSETERLTCDALIKDVADILRKLFKANPIKTWPEVVSMLDDLNSRQDETLKGEMVTSITAFSDDYNLLPQVIPELYKHLIDYESNWVRSRAIRVLGHLLADARSSVPESMIDLLVEVYLRDGDRLIHRATVAALGAYKFSKDRRGCIALEALLKLEEIYYNEGTDTWFLKELLGVLRWSFPDWVEVRRYVVVTILPKYARHPNLYFSEEMVSTLSHYIEDFPEVRSDFLQVALNFFERTERDRYSDGGHSPRRGLWETLENLPADMVASEYAQFSRVVKVKATDDPVEAYRFISTFSSLDLHRQAAELAEVAYETLPDVKAHARWRETFRRVAAAERAETLLRVGDREGALTILGNAAETDLRTA
jgi:hypothetical protein